MDDRRDERITTQIRRHILDGEPDGSGGHRYGTNHPGRTEFPQSWRDEKCLSAVTYTSDHHYQRDDSNPNFTKSYGYFDGFGCMSG